MFVSSWYVSLFVFLSLFSFLSSLLIAFFFLSSVRFSQIWSTLSSFFVLIYRLTIHITMVILSYYHDYSFLRRLSIVVIFLIFTSCWKRRNHDFLWCLLKLQRCKFSYIKLSFYYSIPFCVHISAHLFTSKVGDRTLKVSSRLGCIDLEGCYRSSSSSRTRERIEKEDHGSNT